MFADDYNDPSLPQIDETVVDPDGVICKITQIVECGEVALVEYEDGSEGEWDLFDLEHSKA